MSARTLTVFVTVLISADIFSASIYGRQIDDWPYEKLAKEADLILVAKAISTDDAAADVADKPPRDYLVGVISSFQVKYVIKGALQTKKISVFHYRLNLKEGQEIGDGPLLVSFQAKESRVRREWGTTVLAPPEYMMFLKKRNDGRYECVSGQFDPSLSVRQVTGTVLEPPVQEEGKREPPPKKGRGGRR